MPARCGYFGNKRTNPISQRSRLFEKRGDSREIMALTPLFFWKKSEEARHSYAQVRAFTSQKKKNIPCWLVDFGTEGLLRHTCLLLVQI
jgi:hypothetical protein